MGLHIAELNIVQFVPDERPQVASQALELHRMHVEQAFVDISHGDLGGVARDQVQQSCPLPQFALAMHADSLGPCSVVSCLPIKWSNDIRDLQCQ